MQCFRCSQKVHPVSHGTIIITNTKSDKRSYGEKSKSSKSSWSSKTSKAQSKPKLRNFQVKIKMLLTTLNTII